jgi:hypothetical protein
VEQKDNVVLNIYIGVLLGAFGCSLLASTPGDPTPAAKKA